VHRYFPGILENHDYEKESVYDVLESQYGVQIKRGVETISAMVAPKNLQEILQNSKDQALLYLERISYSQFDVPVEMRHIYYRADRYALQLSVRR
jgi:GntR family transcriptional regulator